MTEAATMDDHEAGHRTAPQKRKRRPGSAWLIPELAEEWRCSERQVYDLIELGSLKAFTVGRPSAKSERGLRVADKERLRWERRGRARTTEADHG